MGWYLSEGLSNLFSLPQTYPNALRREPLWGGKGQNPLACACWAPFSAWAGPHSVVRHRRRSLLSSRPCGERR